MVLNHHTGVSISCQPEVGFQSDPLPGFATALSSPDKDVLTQPAFFYIQLLHLATRIELGRVLTASYFTYLTYRERASIMSQQGMHYEELNRDRSESSYAGYEGMPHHDS